MGLQTLSTSSDWQDPTHISCSTLWMPSHFLISPRCCQTYYTPLMIVISGISLQNIGSLGIIILVFFPDPLELQLYWSHCRDSNTCGVNEWMNEWRTASEAEHSWCVYYLTDMVKTSLKVWKQRLSTLGSNISMWHKCVNWGKSKSVFKERHRPSNCQNKGELITRALKKGPGFENSKISAHSPSNQ